MPGQTAAEPTPPTGTGQPSADAMMAACQDPAHADMPDAIHRKLHLPRSSSQPGVGETAVPGFVQIAGRPKLSQYVRKFKQLIGASVAPADLQAAHVAARAYAGGMARAATRSASRGAHDVTVISPYGAPAAVPSATFEDDADWDEEPAYLDDGDLGDLDEPEDAPPQLEKSDPSVRYRDATDAQATCGSCRFFDGDEQSCCFVEGAIRPNGVCDLQRPAVVAPAAFTESRRFVGAAGSLRGVVFSASTPPEWLPYMPVPGRYEHPDWGEVLLTSERNRRFVEHMNAHVYQDEIPLDGEHQTKLSGAFAYLDRMRQNSDGSVDAHVSRWTDRGRVMVEGDRFFAISPQWFEEWQDPATEQVFQDVPIGGALTNRPFFKSKYLRPIGAMAASETARAIMVDFREFRPSAGRAHEEAPMPTEPTNPQAGTPAAGAAATGAAQTPPATTPVSATEPTPQSFSELQGQLRSMAERVERTERENAALRTLADQRTAAEQERRFRDEILGRSDGNNIRWFGDVESHVKSLRAMAQTYGEDSDDFRSFVEGARKSATVVRESDVFKTYGTAAGASGPDSPESKLKSFADAYREADPSLTVAQASERAMSAHPELYVEYRQRNPQFSGQGRS